MYRAAPDGVGTERRSSSLFPVPSSLLRRGLATGPLRPRVMARKSGPSRRVDPREAWSYPYVQFSPGNTRNLIYADIDDPFKALQAYLMFSRPPGPDDEPQPDDDERLFLLAQRCPPSWFIFNPSKDHAQSVWTMGDPPQANPDSRPKPLYLHGLAQHWVNDVLHGDPCCTGYLLQNPLYWQRNTSEGRIVLLGEENWRGYGLRDFQALIPPDYVLPPRKGKRTFEEHGRNCYVFDETCRLVYADLNLDSYDVARKLNAALPVSLPDKEIRGIAKSVDKYKYRQWLPAKLHRKTPEERSAFGRTNANKRWDRTSESRNALAARALELHALGVSGKAIAKELGCSRRHVTNIINGRRPTS